MKKTIGVMFPGYGEQFVTMGKKLYDDSRIMQDLFEQASMCLDINFVQLCFAASDAEILEIDKGSLAIVLLEASIYSELLQAGLQPDFIAGYGIGEYAAAIASGSLSFADGLYLITKYMQFLKEFLVAHPNYSVLHLARGFTKDSILELCKQYSTDENKVFVTAYNSDSDFYIAAPIDVMPTIQEFCKKNEIRKVKELTVAYELHNDIIEPVIERLAPYYFKVDFKPLKTPVITNVDGVYVTSSDALESAIARRASSPVLWDEVMNGFVGCDILVSVGPGKQLADWARLKYPDKDIYTIEDLADLESFKAFLQEQQDPAVDQQVVDEISFGTCHVNDDIELPKDLTEADLVNELPTDFDIEDEDDLV